MDELDWAIKRLKRFKSPGYDQISAEMIKDISEEYRPFLLNLLNDWWKNANIPEDQLIARIASIFKKGDSSKQGNYRPIAILLVFYKMFTMILHSRISEIIDSLLDKTQYGFRKKRSTVQAIHIINRIIAKIERGGKKRSETTPSLYPFGLGEGF